MEPETIATGTSFISNFWSSAQPILSSWLLEKIPAFLDWLLKYVTIPVVYYIVDYFKSRIVNNNTASVLETTKSLVSSTVARLNQTKVDALKKDGKLSSKVAKELQEEALAEVKLNLNAFATLILSKRFPDVDKYIVSLIEQEVRLQQQQSLPDR